MHYVRHEFPEFMDEFEDRIINYIARLRGGANRFIDDMTVVTTDEDSGDDSEEDYGDRFVDSDDTDDTDDGDQAEESDQEEHVVERVVNNEPRIVSASDSDSDSDDEVDAMKKRRARTEQSRSNKIVRRCDSDD